MPEKLRVATVSLAGCFGCHMSMLDIDERVLELAEFAMLDRSPLTDIKRCGSCDIGLVEGGLCNAENIEVLREFRAHCRLLVAVGACAINGGVPAMRNHFALSECLEEVFLRGMGLDGGHVPNDPELPLLLDRVRPIQEVVRVDYFLPGCPPSADVIWEFLSDVIAGRVPRLARETLRYD
jgi:NAD-reducing hydrogenase small subunit